MHVISIEGEARKRVGKPRIQEQEEGSEDLEPGPHAAIWDRVDDGRRLGRGGS